MGNIVKFGLVLTQFYNTPVSTGEWADHFFMPFYKGKPLLTSDFLIAFLHNKTLQKGSSLKGKN